jgi:hypothetical protein
MPLYPEWGPCAHVECTHARTHARTYTHTHTRIGCPRVVRGRGRANSFCTVCGGGARVCHAKKSTIDIAEFIPEKYHKGFKGTSINQDPTQVFLAKHMQDVGLRAAKAP